MERQEATPQIAASLQAQFKEAAAHVAGELKATGQASDALAAARLQEVSKFVDRVPYVGGLNKENVDKALVAADRLPNLTNAPQLEQLRSATSALGQPGHEQQRASVEAQADVQQAAALLYKVREPERRENAATTRGEESVDTSRQEYSRPSWEGKGGTTPTAKEWLEKEPGKVLAEAPRSIEPQERYLIINTTGQHNMRPMQESVGDRLHEAGAGVTDIQTRPAQNGQPEQGQVRVAYQMGQPTLDAIHHELEQMRGKPGIQIVSDEAQRPERAQVLAVQYRQEMKEQHEESLARKQYYEYHDKQGTLQAPAKPTHDQARETYLANVGPVAQGLKDNGDGLNAARLQDAARFVERTPYLGGINKENVDKAISAADKIPYLSGSKELGELKSSVGVLEKQPGQERTASQSIPSRESGGIER